MVCLYAVLISMTVEYKCATVCNVRSTFHHLWYIIVSTQKKMCKEWRGGLAVRALTALSEELHLITSSHL